MRSWHCCLKIALSYSRALTAQQALIIIDKLNIRLQELPSDERRVLLRGKGAKPSNIGEINVLHVNFYGSIDATRQAIKNRVDHEDLKQQMLDWCS